MKKCRANFAETYACCIQDQSAFVLEKNINVKFAKNYTNNQNIINIKLLLVIKNFIGNKFYPKTIFFTINLN